MHGYSIHVIATSLRPRSPEFREYKWSPRDADQTVKLTAIQQTEGHVEKR